MTRKTNARSEKVRGLQQQVHKPTTTKGWHHCRIYIAKTQTCLHACCLL